MSRRPIKPKNKLMPDTKYNSLKVALLINYIMKDGKKTIAKGIVYDAFDEMSKKLEKDAIIIFENAIQNVGPLVELKSKRVGGANYQIPIEVASARRLVLALRWILLSARAKKGKPLYIKLANEFIDANNNEGQAVLKRQNTQKMAEANRAFAHLSW